VNCCEAEDPDYKSYILRTVGALETTSNGAATDSRLDLVLPTTTAPSNSLVERLLAAVPDPHNPFWISFSGSWRGAEVEFICVPAGNIKEALKSIVTKNNIGALGTQLQRKTNGQLFLVHRFGKQLSREGDDGDITESMVAEYDAIIVRLNAYEQTKDIDADAHRDEDEDEDEGDEEDISSDDDDDESIEQVIVGTCRHILLLTHSRCCKPIICRFLPADTTLRRCARQLSPTSTHA
jgi:hypothetical protein